MEKRGERVATKTMSEVMDSRGRGTPLANLWPGSWISAAYRIWIGDGAKNRATRVDNSWDEKLSGADYIIWPPMISMYRQYLKDSGGLK